MILELYATFGTLKNRGIQPFAFFRRVPRSMAPISPSWRKYRLRCRAKVYPVFREGLVEAAPVLEDAFISGHRQGPPEEITLTCDVTQTSMDTFLAYAHGDDYAIKPEEYSDLDDLADALHAAGFKQKLQAWLADPPHARSVLIPTIHHRIDHDRPTTDLEAQLRDRLCDDVDDPAFALLPLALLNRVFPPLLSSPPDEAVTDQLFLVLQRLLDQTRDRASVLFVHVPITRLTTAQYSALHDRPGFKWAFFADQMTVSLFD
jgi:hypothetical protein